MLLDPAELNRRAMGDDAYKVELLALFVTEIERLLAQAEAAPDSRLRAERLSAIAASARNVGAARLAQAARHGEVRIAAGDLDLEPVRNVAAETLAYISRSRF